MRDDRYVKNPDLDAEEGPTVPEWRDSLGQVFRDGDLIAVATISSRSPQMVIAEVVKINTHDSKGQRHTKTARTGQKVTLYREKRTWIGDPDAKDWPTYAESQDLDLYARTAWQSRQQGALEVQRRWQAMQRDPANWEVEQEPYETDQMWEVQAVTVTARPLLDGRGFHRSDGSKRWWYNEETGESGYEDTDGPKTRPVTYSIIGNIVRLPDGYRQAMDEVIGRRYGDLEW